MRTLLAAGLLLALLVPAGVVAQDDEWPTAYEVRRELQSIGYEFGLSDGGWAGGREVFPTSVSADGPKRAINLIDTGAGAGVWLSIGSDEDGLDWPASTLSALTAFMEVLDIIPTDQVTRQGLHEHIAGDAVGCWERSLPHGGMVSMERTHAVDPWFVMVVPEGWDRLCTDPLVIGVDEARPEPTLEHGVAFQVAPADAVAMIESGDRIVIDVRTPAEYAQAHVVGALNIDVESADFADRIAELDPEQPYLVYCRSGNRSALAAGQMADIGIKDIADAGGLADLARAGAPIE